MNDLTPLTRALTAANQHTRNTEQNSTDKLIARANAAITVLRHGADAGHCDAAKARRLADTIQRQLCAPHDTHLIFGSYPQGSDVWATLAMWKEWIDMFARQTYGPASFRWERRRADLNGLTCCNGDKESFEAFAAVEDASAARQPNQERQS